MHPFDFSRADSERAALAAGAGGGRYIAGGTTLVDLMRETVERPTSVVDINALPYRQIEVGPAGPRAGALVRMTDLADHAKVREQFPVISQALDLSASAQLRNMASIGGNLMQRPRCLSYEFALASAAVALDIRDGVISSARVAAGGVATVPWRLPGVEDALRGRPPSPGLWTDAVAHAADGARPLPGNAFKVELLR